MCRNRERERVRVRVRDKVRVRVRVEGGGEVRFHNQQKSDSRKEDMHGFDVAHFFR